MLIISKGKYFSKRFFYLDARTQKLQNGGSILRFDLSVYKIFTKIEIFNFGFFRKNYNFCF